MNTESCDLYLVLLKGEASAPFCSSLSSFCRILLVYTCDVGKPISCNPNSLADANLCREGANTNHILLSSYPPVCQKVHICPFHQLVHMQGPVQCLVHYFTQNLMETALVMGQFQFFYNLLDNEP